MMISFAMGVALSSDWLVSAKFRNPKRWVGNNRLGPEAGARK